MAYTPTKVWADGDTFDASDLASNLDGVRQYVFKLESSAIKSVAPWADSTQIMRGTYEPSPNRYHMVSGIWSGSASTPFDGMFTYAGKWDTGIIADDALQSLPHLCVSYEPRKPNTVFSQWWASASTWPSMGTVQRYTDFMVSHGRVTDRTLPGVMKHSVARSLSELTPQDLHMQRSTAEVQAEAIPTTVFRHHLYGFGLFDSALSGEYDVGVTYHSTAPKTQVYAWGISLECFYL